MSKSGFAKDVLKSFVERIERLQESKDAVSEDMKAVYSEAASSGFDVKILRQVIRKRKMDRAEMQEADAVFALYWGALEGTPLGDYARDKIAAE